VLAVVADPSLNTKAPVTLLGRKLAALAQCLPSQDSRFLVAFSRWPLCSADQAIQTFPSFFLWGSSRMIAIFAICLELPLISKKVYGAFAAATAEPHGDSRQVPKFTE
jgi:hypothetical protein